MESVTDLVAFVVKVFDSLAIILIDAIIIVSIHLKHSVSHKSLGW